VTVADDDPQPRQAAPPPARRRRGLNGRSGAKRLIDTDTYPTARQAAPACQTTRRSVRQPRRRACVSIRAPARRPVQPSRGRRRRRPLPGNRSCPQASLRRSSSMRQQRIASVAHDDQRPLVGVGTGGNRGIALGHETESIRRFATTGLGSHHGGRPTIPDAPDQVCGLCSDDVMHLRDHRLARVDSGR
jgi:hypothetical protein